MSKAAVAVLLGLSTSFTVGCKDNTKVSASKAVEHAAYLAKTVETDVQEVRAGLPEGAKHLVKLYETEAAPKDDLRAVREALENARNKVQDLRVAKSTFFALVDEHGIVVRNDQEQDLMVGKNALQSFPEIKQALGGKYVETQGSMPEAAGVKGADGQWVAAAPISAAGKVRGVYLTGWSWSAYAYRLETALRNEVKSGLSGPNDKMPLLYVYIVVDKQAFGAPVSPEVNAAAIADRDPMSKLQGDQFSTTLEITGRGFGMAVKKAASLGPSVGVAVLRSET